jgi:hypothetical protein
MPWDMSGFWIGWKYLPLVAPYHGNDMTLSGIAEKVVQSDTEYQSNSRERRKRGHQPPVFEARQHCGRKSSVFSQLSKAHAAAQSQSTKLVRYRIWPQGFLNDRDVSGFTSRFPPFR